jgi:hypothetical protein
MRNASVAALGCLIFVSCGDTSSDSSNNPVSGAGAASASAPICQASQTLICHVPPGDPADEQSICVGTAAVKAHLAHGDHLGACCTPLTCALQGASCGTISDGCGGTLGCGACPSHLTCGGGGVPNQCGTACMPLTACPAGDNCGTVDDGCGGTIDCGACLDVTVKLGAGVTLPVGVTLASFSASFTNPAGLVKTIPFAPTAPGSTTFGADLLKLAAGSYSVTLLPPPNVSFSSAPSVPVNVTLSAGATADQDFTITAASSP